MRGPEQVIRAPLISEKGSLLVETSNQVLFKVRPDANKIEVKKAVESLFKVKVVKVRMARYLGKLRRVGRNMGRRTLGGKARGWGRNTGTRPKRKKRIPNIKEGRKESFFPLGRPPNFPPHTPKLS